MTEPSEVDQLVEFQGELCAQICRLQDEAEEAHSEVERLRIALDAEIREKITRTADYEAELQRCREALRECVRLSGADLSGGFPTWPELPEFAVQEVRQLREDSES